MTTCENALIRAALVHMFEVTDVLPPMVRSERYSDRRSGNRMGLHILVHSGAESIRFDSERCPF